MRKTMKTMSTTIDESVVQQPIQILFKHDMVLERIESCTDHCSVLYACYSRAP